METLAVKDYGLDINMPGFINVIGMPNSGKTTLLKMLINRVHNPNIYLNGKMISEYEIEFKKRNIAVCLEMNFNTAYVKEELVYYLGQCHFDVKESFDRLEAFSDYFDMEEIINEKIKYLSIYNKAFIKILSLLILNPSILGIDNLFSYLDEKQKQLIIKYAKEHKITILNITTNKEDLLLGTDIVVLENYKVKANKKTKTIVSDEKLLASVGFELPFIINISNGCNLYTLTDKTYYDSKSLVGVLWK